MKNPSNKQRHIRSYVIRDSRMTAAQRAAYQKLWPQFGLSQETGLLDYQKVFQRTAPCFLEIGFGSGQSLLAAAATYPEQDFIGIETHKPGVGALLLGMQAAGLQNIRIYNTDVVEILEHCIPEASLAGILIFFPDPWQKRRHHKRRLIQPAFIESLVKRLKIGGLLHLATDWEDYAKHMLKVLSAEKQLSNVADANQFAKRSPYRPIITRFEKRSQQEARQVWELQFVKSASSPHAGIS